MFDNQTIAAVATPVGRGGVGIIRISGTSARHCAQRIVGHVPTTRYAEYVGFNDENGRTIDRGIALFFAAPNSYTGEDVLELQAHGGSAVLDLLLKEVDLMLLLNQLLLLLSNLAEGKSRQWERGH